ncbi:MAG TPA: hypothetical protein VFE05_05480, partial [Longimicrobiaceae bacterium]|nr:hypothetical protein [Longimicrobiaceae bacterium]
MYRTCIFCSADLGTNDSVEEFPVGRTLAFDAGKGRLWAVCPKCARWNLAPIEERWEAVESSEKLFADARLRVQSENIGLAKLRDGTRLIRVGQALPGEMAAWRYGTQLVKRRRRYLAAGAVAVAGGAVWAGLAVTGVLGGAAGLTSVAVMAWQQYRGKRPVHRLSREESPTGEEIGLNRFSLNAARVARGADGAIALHLPYALPAGPARWKNGRKVWFPERSLVLEGPTARTVLGRAMVDANSGGAGARRLHEALGLLGDAGGAEEYLRRAAGT